MLTIIMFAALLGTTDYALVTTSSVNDYAFAPLPLEHLAIVRPAKRTEPTPAKCPGGLCVANPHPQAIKTKSVLVHQGDTCTDCQPNQSSMRRTLWRGRSFRLLR
jgi:hypothetical protein